jgi:AbrB family looped-hinge helix DNA binding protein
LSSEASVTEFLGVATVGERGQIVIPAEARRRYDIKPGDKLMILSHPSGPALVIARVTDLLRVINHMQELLRIAETASQQSTKGDDA